MAKQEVAEGASEALAPVALDAVSEITLEEFCTRLSMVDKRVELIGAFESTEKASGTIKSQESAFKARFEAFATKPA